MKIIRSDAIPEPAGHYSPIVEHGGLLYVSGQLPIDARDRSTPDGIEAQTLLVLDNLDLLLREAGSSRDRVLQVRIYIADIELWGAVNATYAEWFGDHRPARCIVPTKALHFGCLLELEATAVAAAAAEG